MGIQGAYLTQVLGFFGADADTVEVWDPRLLRGVGQLTVKEETGPRTRKVGKARRHCDGSRYLEQDSWIDALINRGLGAWC